MLGEKQVGPRILGAVLLLLAAGVALAQNPDDRPRFVVASIKMLPAPAPGQPFGSESIVANPGSLIMRNIRLRACVKWAYGVKEYQILSPAWMGSAGWMGPDISRFEIIAKAAEDTPVSQLRLMLQSLLAERFKMAFHREMKEMPASALVVVNQAPGLRPSENQDGRSSMVPNGAILSFQMTSLPEFAEFVSGPLGVPVLDMTELKGRFDFKIDVTSFGITVERGDQRDAFLQAMQAQLGLKLERRKAPIEMLVVDRAEKAPTEN
jgi:uncharacterized protein (TIGR03435 family)